MSEDNLIKYTVNTTIFITKTSKIDLKVLCSFRISQRNCNVIIENNILNFIIYYDDKYEIK